MVGRRESDKAHRPRKEPKQERSRATVDAIFTAAEEVFERLGYAETTTDHIAERAGVSVGTLYQYFPTKDALLAVLAERHVAATGMALGPVILQADSTTDLSSFIHELAKRFFAVRRKAPRLFRAIVEEAPLLNDFSKRAAQMELVARGGIAHYLRGVPELGRDPDLAAAMVMVMLDAFSWRVTVYPPASCDADQLEKEAVAMLLSYLTPSAPRAET